MREAHIILKRRQEYSDCQVFQIPMLTWHQACYHATCVQRQDGKCMKMPTKRTNKRIHSCPILTFSWHSFCDLSRSFSFPSHCLHVGCYDSCFLMWDVNLYTFSTLRPWVLCLHHGNGSGAPKREKMYANDICETFVKYRE